MAEPIATAAEALAQHQWAEGQGLLAAASAHTQHRYDGSCPLCRMDLPDSPERAVRVVFESVDTDVIATVLSTHRVVGITVGTGKRTARCACSFDFDGEDGRDDFDRHRAAEVKAALLGGAS